MTCPTCGDPLPPLRRPGRPRIYCSDPCRRAAYTGWQGERQKRELRERLGCVNCANPYCVTTLVPLKGKQYCSPSCLYIGSQIRAWGDSAGQSAAIQRGMLDACRIWFCRCPDCGTQLVQRARNGTATVCPPCRKRRNKAINARKNHARRAAGRHTLSVHELAARDGERCNLCRKRVDMALSGRAKWGPTVDHLVPVSQGGTNDAANLALAHRHCNTARKNRGHAQLLLVA